METNTRNLQPSMPEINILVTRKGLIPCTQPGRLYSKMTRDKGGKRQMHL